MGRAVRDGAVLVVVVIAGMPMMTGAVRAEVAVGVVRQLLDDGAREAFVRATREQYEELRRQFADRDDRVKRLTIEEARANRLTIDWAGSAAAPVPTSMRR